MVRTVAELLITIIEREKPLLGQYDLTHAPTIGEMYEQLSEEILEKALPEQLHLKVVNGFIVNDIGTISPQMDCIIARDVIEEIPRTGKYKCHINDVLAVVEVKKSLYGSDVQDSFPKLRSVCQIQREEIELELAKGGKVDISSARRVFSQMTGIVAPYGDSIKDLSQHHQALYHALVVEQCSPVRIAFGYDGFQSEGAFRKSFSKFLQKNLKVHGYGPTSFPDLCVSNGFSLLKCNGQPYVAKAGPDWWRFYVSSHENPLVFFLEYLWTKIARECKVGGLWGEDLDVEAISVYLDCRSEVTSSQRGWVYHETVLDEAALSSPVVGGSWEPLEVNDKQFVIFNLLCKGEPQQVDDPRFISFVASTGKTVDQFLSELLSTGMIALDGNRLALTTRECGCVVLPDGRFVVGENNTGRLARWVSHNTRGEAESNDTQESAT